MKNKLRQYCLLLLLCILFLAAHAQQDTIVPVSFGETIPKYASSNMLNYKGTLTLASFEGKKLLIVFWSTYCLTCIESFPKLIAIQEKNKASLQIILVTDQGKTEIGSFLERRKKLTGLLMPLPIIYSDTTLAKIFPHNGDPYYVWVNRGGTVQDMMYADAMSQKNISKQLTTDFVASSVKKEKMAEVSSWRPLFINGNGGNGEGLLYYSVVSRYIEGIPTIQGIYNIDSFYADAGDPARTYMIVAFALTHSIKEIFQVAYNDHLNGYSIPNNRTVLKVKDSTRIVSSYDGMFHWDRIYNYQLVAPSSLSVTEVQLLMQEEIKKYFKLKSGFEKRVVKCWVLRSTDTSLTVSKGGDPSIDWSLTDFSIRFKNTGAPEFENFFIHKLFDWPYSPYPFVNETKIKGGVDMLLENIVPTDTGTIIKALRKYKMELKLEDHEINILVLQDE